MESGERIRLFCALDLPDEARDELCRVGREAALADRGRLVPAENLHVTLAFLGHRPAGEVPAIVAELRAASAAARPAELRPLRYRETRSVGMIVLDDVGGAATALADDLQARLERLGVYRREAPAVAAARHRPPASGTGRRAARAGEQVFDSCRPVGSLPFFPRSRWSHGTTHSKRQP